MNSYDAYNALLLEVQKNPKKYIEGKSLKALIEFIGKNWKIAKKETSLEWIELLYFTHEYYNMMIPPSELTGGASHPASSITAYCLIQEMSGTDEEAFDKYFEIRNKYLKLKEEMGDDFMKQYVPWL